jgi:hypothetical protein
MNTLVLVTRSVNYVVASSVPDVDRRLLDLIAVLHALIGALIVVVAFLLVATAGPRWRSRIGALFVAVLMVGLVVVGCAPSASAATSVAVRAEESNLPLYIVGAGMVIVVGALFCSAVRAAFHVLVSVARALELMLIVRHAVLITGALALTLIVAIRQ